MWLVITVLAALSLLPCIISMIIAVSNLLTPKLLIKFTALSSLVLCAFALIGCLFGWCVNLIADVSFMYWIVLFVVAVNFFVKAFKIEKFIMMFYTDNVKDFVVATSSAGIDVMLAAMGCFLFKPDFIWMLVPFFFVCLALGFVGVFVGLKSVSAKIIKYFVGFIGVVIMFSLFFNL